MNILIVKLSAIGDVVMSLPFLDAVRRSFPDARLTWLVEEAAADIVLDHPAIDRVIVSRRKAWSRNLKSGNPAAAFGGMYAFLKELRRDHYDIVVDLQGLFKSGILIFLARGTRKVGFDRTRELSYLFLNDRIPKYDPDRHALKRYLDAAAYLGADVRGIDYFLPVHPPSQKEAADLLEGLGGRSARPLVALNPGAKWRTKLWPDENWRALGKALVDDGYRIVLTGGPDEAEDNARIASVSGRILDLTGRTRLKTLAEVFRVSNLVICPDTGPMHLAAAVKTPVAALFGPTAPGRTGPFGQGHVILRAGSACSPCFRKQCGQPRCMTDLTPAMVLEAVRSKLETR